MDEANLKKLEQHYQTLTRDYQAGKLDQARFIAEVDKLQFQDEWGRYWMLGAQTGTWHYYDGQTWHQADPRQADKLPFMDEQGRYWQKGAKSGDWYLYQAETGEWVKPGQGDAPATMGGYGAYQAQPQVNLQSVGSGPDMPLQFDGELYQDDEGRYWAVGKKTGQWYFYDHNGWHSAQEYRPTAPAPMPPLPAYTPPAQPPAGGFDTRSYQPYPPQGFQQPAAPAQESQPAGTQPMQGYMVQPQQPGSPMQPIQIYITSPSPDSQPVARQEIIEPAQPAAKAVPVEKPAADTLPVNAETRPPKERSESGSWFYFDGEQWLKYAGSESEEKGAPPPKMVVDQPAQPAKEKPAPEPVVAEYFDNEPPVEVVDVEVITVIEAEPDPKFQPRRQPAQPEPAPTGPLADDVRPRRATLPMQPIRTQENDEPDRQPRPRTATEPRPVMPRRREPVQEPTLIIPTGAAASNISSPSAPAARSGQPVVPSPGERRRARENTVPIEPVAPAARDAAATESHRQHTQPMPRIPTDTAPVARPASQPVRVKAQTAAQAAAEPAEPAAPKSGFTVGQLLRSMPSTVWTAVGGVALLLICAVGLVLSWGWLQGGDTGVGSLVAVPSLTPTLDAGPPDSTPTPGPTPTAAPDANVTATPATLAVFSSETLGFAVEYPETWKQADDESCGIFSPSSGGLTRDNLKDAAIWICKSAESGAAIADLLAEVLAEFPADAETLNEGTISIASQTWTSAQIKYDAENFDSQGIATLAVTNKDDDGYYLVAVSPADTWNTVQPLFQTMINSFTFSPDTLTRASTPEAKETPAAQTTATRQKIVAATAAAQASPAPKGTATPLVYVVQSGDTLLAIAIKFGIDADVLAAKNNITNPQSLQIGQELVIPFSSEQLADFAEKETTVAKASPTAAGSSAADQATPAAAPAEPTPAPSEAAPVSGRIVYPAFNPGTNVFDVWMVNLATGEQTIIASEASQPAFNKDGSLLAYRSWRRDTRGIIFRDFVGGRGGLVTRFVEDALPTWSPDGFTFAFASRREGDRVPRVYVGNQMGDGDFGVGFQGEYPSTFPDGRLVAKGCSPSGDCGIYVLGATGGGENKISGESSDTAPAVSPDGRKIAFMSAGRGGTNWEIWVMNPDGSNPQRLTDNGSNDGLPAWSPDSKTIAFVSDQGGVWSIWAMNVDGSNQRKLSPMNGSPDGKVLHDVDNSRGWLEERISWAP